MVEPELPARAPCARNLWFGIRPGHGLSLQRSDIDRGTAGRPVEGRTSQGACESKTRMSPMPAWRRLVESPGVGEEPLAAGGHGTPPRNAAHEPDRQEFGIHKASVPGYSLSAAFAGNGEAGGTRLPFHRSVTGEWTTMRETAVEPAGMVAPAEAWHRRVPGG